jgi:hypothetical protein
VVAALEAVSRSDAAFARAGRSGPLPFDVSMAGRVVAGAPEALSRGEHDMPRFLSMVRIDESAIGDRVPSPALMERMDGLIEEMQSAGVLVDTAGLKRSAEGTRVHWSRGKATVIDGPFTESKEVVGGFIILETRDEAEAIEWTTRFLLIHGDEFELTCELREIDTV